MVLYFSLFSSSPAAPQPAAAPPAAPANPNPSAPAPSPPPSPSPSGSSLSSVPSIGATLDRRFPSSSTPTTADSVSSEISSIEAFFRAEDSLDEPGKLPRRKKFLVVGAGLTGLFSAYFLSRAGYSVTVVDKGPCPSPESPSVATGIVKLSAAEPTFTNFRYLRHLGTTFCPLPLTSHPDFRDSSVDSRFTSAFFMNIMPFLGRDSTKDRMRQLYGLGLYSRWLMNQVAESIGFPGSFNSSLTSKGSKGSLQDSRPLSFTGLTRIYTDRSIFQRRILETLRNSRIINNTDLELISSMKFHSLVPVANHIDSNHYLSHSASDQAFEPASFISSMVKSLEKAPHNVQFQWNTNVKKFHYGTQGELIGVATNRGTVTADKYVLATGYDSLRLLPSISNLATVVLAPMASHSLTFRLPASIPHSTHSFAVSLPENQTDIANFGGTVRVSSGFKLGVRTPQTEPERVEEMVKAVQKVWPQLQKEQILGPADAPNPMRVALRVLTADGLPVVGPLAIRNSNSNSPFITSRDVSPHPDVFVATGAGFLDWTLAAAMGKLVTDVAIQRPSIIDPNNFDMKRAVRGGL